MTAVGICDFKLNFALLDGCLYLVLCVGVWLFVVLTVGWALLLGWCGCLCF